MGHDVFLSYSSLDKLAADAVCHGLEAKGIRCWIAPRDQVAGQPYGEQITAAIQSAQVMVLIFSDNVNKSHAVHNEVDLAAAANVTIVPFRLAGVDFNPELQFYLGRVHWLDAFPHPVDEYIDDLAATVQRNLTRRAPIGVGAPARRRADGRARARRPPQPSGGPPARRRRASAAGHNRPLVFGLAAAGRAGHPDHRRRLVPASREVRSRRSSAAERRGGGLDGARGRGQSRPGALFRDRDGPQGPPGRP